MLGRCVLNVQQRKQILLICVQLVNYFIFMAAWVCWDVTCEYDIILCLFFCGGGGGGDWCTSFEIVFLLENAGHIKWNFLKSLVNCLLLKSLLRNNNSIHKNQNSQVYDLLHHTVWSHQQKSYLLDLLLKYIIHGCIPKHYFTAIKPSQACYLISLAT